MVLHKCSWTLQCSISTISISNFLSQQPYNNCPFLSGLTSNTTHWHTDTAPLFFTIILKISFICLQLLAQFVVRQPQHMQHSRRSCFVSFLPYNFLLVRYRHPTLPSKSMKQCCSSGSIVHCKYIFSWVCDMSFWLSKHSRIVGKEGRRQTSLPPGNATLQVPTIYP